MKYAWTGRGRDLIFFFGGGYFTCTFHRQVNFTVDPCRWSYTGPLFTMRSGVLRQGLVPSWSSEAARFGFRHFQSLCNLATTAALPRYTFQSNTRSCGKTSARVVNRCTKDYRPKSTTAGKQQRTNCVHIYWSSYFKLSVIRFRSTPSQSICHAPKIQLNWFKNAWPILLVLPYIRVHQHGNTLKIHITILNFHE